MPRQGIQWVKAKGIEPARMTAGRKNFRMVFDKAIMKRPCFSSKFEVKGAWAPFSIGV